jgi:hypothetical protein
MFPFFLPTLEYRNKTWSWYNFIEEVRRDAIRVIFANTGALVREKIFPKKRVPENQSRNLSSQASLLSVDTTGRTLTDTSSLKSTKSRIERFFKRKRSGTTGTSSTESSQVSPNRRSKSEGSTMSTQIDIANLDTHRATIHMSELNDEKGRQLFGKFYP